MNIETISAVTALIAVIVGPTVSILIAKKQIKSSVVSKNRQDWIISLREQVSELMSDFQYLPNASIDGELQRNEVLALHKEILRKSNLVRLHLNMDEQLHIDLMDNIDQMNKELLQHIRGGLFNYTKMSQMCFDSIEQCSFIVKDEWKKVKSGE
ncbi:hypothetical protein ATG66_2697 [Vibrio sp. ES.051]|uniref:hypothetical protein n=1 Tax=Vibrio sp. ES.051 TaxID=1761909 RepID=UPI000BF51C14|nr:hypothetical protein [Vibrio sp. ES.051]PFG56365.1 hypothetical protein ATG66_2697 [Vibrio sp. ES.051]